MKPDAVIFDWAGTLIDPGCRAPVLAFQAAFAQAGISLPEPLVRRDMGRGKRDHTVRLLAEPQVGAAFCKAHGRAPGPADVESLYRAVSEAMAGAVLQSADPVPGAAGILDELAAQGVRIGSTTGYPRDVMDALLPHARAQGIAPEIVVCAEEVADPRPGPGQILACLEAFAIADPGRCAKVDDTLAGLQAGRAAGCFSIAVTASGNPLDPHDLAGCADAACASLADLPACLDALFPD